MSSRCGLLVSILIVLVLAPACGASGLPARKAPSMDPTADLIEIPAAAYVMGDAAGELNEAPHEVVVGRFMIMRREVTNDQFAQFVRSTEHVTDAERAGLGLVWSGSWAQVPGADWRHPHGPRSSITGHGEHPVVQISWRDASVFCMQAGLRLPTEEEWELAARGTDGRRYPWGHAPPSALARSAPRANAGTARCCAQDDRDGYGKTAPVGSYRAGRSPYGLDDMAGNVWEWTASSFPARPGRVVLRGGGWGNNDHGLRVSYRHANPRDRGLDMVGFRCAK